MAREYHEQIMFSMVALFQNVNTDLEKLKTETGALARHQEFYHKAKIYKPVGISRTPLLHCKQLFCKRINVYISLINL